MNELEMNLVEIESLLVKYNESNYASMFNGLRNKLHDRDTFFRLANSNEIWGGSGSLADQGLCDSNVDSGDMVVYLKAMIFFGTYISKNYDNRNARISGWIQLFEMMIRKRKKENLGFF